MKAEDYANKRFPPNIGEDYRPICGGFEIVESDFNSDRRYGCKIGYEQAEKDLALTWEDIEKITDIHRNVLYDNPKRIMGAKENYEDTLKKFNEWREKNRATKK